ncbi:MAG TPA: glucose-1-phosphate adenylyltransferase subunit GlgD [Candidatus Blautia gallistercoris]|uniref:Glucose-1-phosphate adenylyltransferase subunit GlgD n=1 Tax=Candidatus Blautia gallistercoris TaxID=2838490 RepID=A0A9D2B3D0_9FIRM|nr:glucose-1-phosphate adenylyltransferase subunit GlgD [Candidatus Blautia gallistercoris]
MVNSNADAMGIIFPNSYDSLVPELVSVRLMASIPFASRYRLIDFMLSGMVNSGIGNISILVRNNYHSLMDHLGSGREWDLARKNGGLNIFPPYSDKNVKVYNGRVDALASILGFLRGCKEKFVIMCDTNKAVNFDFKALIDAHVESGADVTVVYNEAEIPKKFLENHGTNTEMYYTFSLEGDKVRKIYLNSEKPGVQNLSMNIYIIERELLIDKVNTAFVHGLPYFERDILAAQLDKLDVRAFRYDGYVARIADMQSYFNENMRLLDDENLDALFSGNPIYTKIRDDNPTRYMEGSKVSNVMAADGCVIEGEVENSILFRGVKVGKGAKVTNCVLMQDTCVGPGAVLDYVVSDKNVTISEGKEIKGNDTFPVFIAKRQKV